MAEASNRTADEEIEGFPAGTGSGTGTGSGDGGENDAPPSEEGTTTIAMRPDLIVGTRRFRLASLVASEGYNIGWCAHAIFAFGVPGGGASRIDILATLADRDLSPGRRAKVNLRIEAEGNESLHDQTIRSWPCMVSRMVPQDSEDDTRALCRIELVDPIGYLASREIWGAYRDVGASELVGGAIALAAGADEGPTTEVAMAYLPTIRVRGLHRDALDVIPYAVASGETLGEWLARVLGMLGLRAELFAEDGGDTQVMYLTDALAHRGSYEMHVEREGVELSEEEQGRDGGVSIRSRVAFPGNPLRGALLDDPTQGTPRKLVWYGPVGHVVRAQGADTDEVTERAVHEVRRGICEALMVRASSGHPGIEPGRTVVLNETINRIDHWQVASARHLVRGGVYDNDATLLRADTAWHPPEPEPRGTVIVTAMVDHSDQTLYNEPVPRDRLGRINVRFGFLPPLDREIAFALADADVNRDGSFSLDDIDETQRDDYSANAEEWEKKVQAYESGEYEDLHPGIPNAALTEEQLAEREERTRQRYEAITYIYYKRLAATPPATEDGSEDAVQGADEEDDNPRAGSTGDERAPVKPGGQNVFEGSETRPQAPDGNGGTEIGEGAERADAGTQEGEEDEVPPPDNRRLPDPDAETDDAQPPGSSEERWPPRIALPVVEPMAGAMHSFVGGHRQGDICRVAVHDPFSAEIVGYQYRDNRAINRDVVGAAAAIVVEHNFEDAWSGIVVRRIEDMEDVESDQSSDAGADGEDAEEQDSGDAAPEAPGAVEQAPESEPSPADSETDGTNAGEAAGTNGVDENPSGASGADE